MPIWIKYLVTAAVIVGVTELGKRADKLGAILAALPLVTTLAMAWWAIELSGSERTERIANHAFYTFWYVVPTLPMFLGMPWMLKKGCPLWLGFTAYFVGTALCFWLFALLMRRFGIELMP